MYLFFTFATLNSIIIKSNFVFKGCKNEKRRIIWNSKKIIKEKVEEETEKIAAEIKLRRAEFEMKQKETKQIIENFKKNSSLRKRLMDAFPKLEIRNNKKK